MYECKGNKITLKKDENVIYFYSPMTCCLFPGIEKHFTWIKTTMLLNCHISINMGEREWIAFYEIILIIIICLLSQGITTNLCKR